MAGAPEIAPLLSWAVAVVVLLTRAWRICWRMNSDGAERLAEAEGRSSSTDVWVVVAAVASLGAMVDALIRSGNRDAAAVVLVVLGVHTVLGAGQHGLRLQVGPSVLPWRARRGINVKQDRPPTCSDFAYMAFTVGMTYGVTETEPTSTTIRRTALGHALLSYLFGTAILAVAVNLVTSIASQ